MAEASSGTSGEEKAMLLLTEVRWRRDDQVERHEALNRRINTMFALNFAVLAILGASLRFGEISLPGFVEYLIYATIYLLVINVAILLRAYVIGQGTRRPDLTALLNLTASLNTLEVGVRWIAREIEFALEANEVRIVQKGRLTSLAMGNSLLAVLMVASVAALALRFAEPLAP